MKEQIFISYKRVDKERVFAIKDFIEQNTGAKCWIDLEGIESNAQFADKIGTAIDNCQVFIFMRSNEHNTITDLAKDWTYREVNYALDEDKNIIVINLDQSPMPKWFKMLFPNKQEIDATNSDMLNRLCDDLCSWLGILKPAIKSEGKSQKKAKRDALPKEPFRVGNLTYKASGNGGVSVCGCDKSLKEVHIPAKVEYGGYNYDVDSIGGYAFKMCESLTSITIPDSVTSIRPFAFYECESLTTITIPDSVTNIEWGTFSRCFSLTTITIPNSVTCIGNNAFAHCQSLTSITIPDSVTSIGEYAFCGCHDLTSITIPVGVTSIGDSAFWACPGLISISIPDSVTSICDSAFLGCSGLSSISIPDSVTSIGRFAFEGCSSLSSISIPNSVTSIGNSAFRGCSGLTSIIVEKGNEKYDSRENCNAIIETATNTLIRGCDNTIIPNSVTSIGDSAFDRCKSLTTISIPNSVTSIGEGAFDRCFSLTSITIPNSVTSIGKGAFDRCNSLKKITIPKKLTSIGNDAIPKHTRVRKRGSFWPF